MNFPHSMRILFSLFLIFFLLAASQLSVAQPDTTGGKRHVDPGEPVPTFYRLLETQWDYLMHEYPEWATDVGYTGQNGKWTDQSFDAIERRQTDAHDFVKILRFGNRAEYLDDQGKFEYSVVMFASNDQIASFPFHEELLPISQLYGIQQDIPYKLSSQPNNKAEDYNDILSRMRSIPFLIDQVITLMNKGIEMKITQPKITMRDVPDQVKNLLADNPRNSPLLAPFMKFPAILSGAEQATLMSMALQVYRDSIVPAVKKLYDYLVNTYIPNCRESIAMKDLPDGKDWYAYKVRHHTTTSMDPEDIFDLGMSEVRRIRAEMDSLRQATGFKGDLKEFFQYLRTDPKFFYTDSASLMNGYKAIAAKANAALPKLFGKLPKLGFEVVPVPAYSQKSQTTAYYNQGSLKTGRPGYFFANTYDLAARPKWEMEPLTLHESVPGHHLQISLAEENDNKPDLLKNTSYTAFIEGWGLYAESLGNELGFYKDPYNRMGQLTYEMWRSIRLVVDVGIHYKGWSRQQAIDFFEENSGISKKNIEVEVDRYIVDPGQALAYKIGELKIKEIRAYTEKEQGSDFNIRAFHDALLKDGALPLDVLDRKMKIRVKVLQGKK